VLLCIGLLITISGWYVDHGEVYSPVRRVFAPRYDRTLAVYSALVEGGFVEERNPGLADLLNVVAVKATVRVVRVQGLAAGTVQTSLGLLQYRGFRFALEDGQQIDRAVNSESLELQLREAYLDRPLRAGSQLVMLLGLALAFGTGFCAIRRPEGVLYLPSRWWPRGRSPMQRRLVRVAHTK